MGRDQVPPSKTEGASTVNSLLAKENDGHELRFILERDGPELPIPREVFKKFRYGYF